MRPFTDLISLSLSPSCRFSPSTLFVAEQITRSSENLSFIITRNICANDIFLSSAQASTVLLVSISRFLPEKTSLQFRIGRDGNRIS